MRDMDILDVLRAGSSAVVFKLFVLTPVCQFHLFGGFSLLLSALAGVRKLAIFAGENSALNSFHLGQDCPQSSGT